MWNYNNTPVIAMFFPICTQHIWSCRLIDDKSSNSEDDDTVRIEDMEVVAVHHDKCLEREKKVAIVFLVFLQTPKTKKENLSIKHDNMHLIVNADKY